ncbi:MAG: hypothetical protein KC502_00330 [Myxococcales bacterium]|nr:hypothetical protein [Myxococcales bacterium]
MTPSPSTDSQRLSQLLSQLAEAGCEPATTGPVALSMASDIPLPGALRTPIWIRGDQVPADAVASSTEMGLTLQSSDNPVATARLAADTHVVRAWTLIGTAEGVTETLPGVQDEVAKGKLNLRHDARRSLWGDATRLLDLGVWAAKTGLVPTSELTRQARRDSGHVLGLDRQVWCERFGTLLVAWRASVGLQFLNDARILPLMVPEVCAMVDFHKSCRVHHKDIWDHTLQVVDKCPPTLTVRWTALMHDTGKVWTRSVTGKGKVHFFRHEELGGSLMEGVAGRFHMDEALRDRIVYVISNHARANVYATDWTDSAVRRLIRDMGEHLDDVIAFSRSDYTTKRAWRIKEVRSLGVELVKRITEVREADARVPPLPKGFGNVVMARTGRPGGPWLGQMQRWLEAEVDAGRVDAGLDAEVYLAYVLAQGPELLESGRR